MKFSIEYFLHLGSKAFCRDPLKRTFVTEQLGSKQVNSFSLLFVWCETTQSWIKVQNLRSTDTFSDTDSYLQVFKIFPARSSILAFTWDVRFFIFIASMKIEKRSGKTARKNFKPVIKHSLNHRAAFLQLFQSKKKFFIERRRDEMSSCQTLIESVILILLQFSIRLHSWNSVAFSRANKDGAERLLYTIVPSSIF